MVKKYKGFTKNKVGTKNIIPALVRTDFTCCLNNKAPTPSNYFLNEVEHQDAGSYVNNENITYPYVQVMADTFVKKAYELVEAGFKLSFSNSHLYIHFHQINLLY